MFRCYELPISFIGRRTSLLSVTGAYRLRRNRLAGLIAHKDRVIRHFK